MPRGGHRGQWYSIRTGAGGSCKKFKQWDDYYTPRWTFWYKQSVSSGNNAALPRDIKNAPVGSLWSLQMRGALPAAKQYTANVMKYLEPLKALPGAEEGSCSVENSGSSNRAEYMLRALEGAKLDRGTARSCLVRPGPESYNEHPMAELMRTTVAAVRNESLSATQSVGDPSIVAEDVGGAVPLPPGMQLGDSPCLQQGMNTPGWQQGLGEGTVDISGPPTTTFLVHKLQRLIARAELYWIDQRSTCLALDPQKGDNVLPFIDENAVAMNTLSVSDILYMKHRTRRRHHPYWVEIDRVHRNWKKHHLHNNRVAKEEARARVGAFRKAQELQEGYDRR
ncbi:unnamed protein product [Amoebophrya sp. A25]|nr:unnamed protein product [Amoebophrya sp. A25]|eukprot:GSA25T00020818001.1